MIKFNNIIKQENINFNSQKWDIRFFNRQCHRISLWNLGNYHTTFSKDGKVFVYGNVTIDGEKYYTPYSLIYDLIPNLPIKRDIYN